MSTQSFPQRLKQQLVQVTNEFFAANCIGLLEEKNAGRKEEDFHWTGIIGLAGDQITGSLALSCTQDLLDKTHPNHGLGMPVGAEDLVDWLGEITNQLLGRLKNCTLDYGVSFSLSAPSVVKGITLEVQDQGKRQIQTFYFEADKIPLQIKLMITMKQSIDYDNLVKVEKKGNVAEGDGFLF